MIYGARAALQQIADLPRGEIIRLSRAKTSSSTLKLVCRWRLCAKGDQWEELCDFAGVPMRPKADRAHTQHMPYDRSISWAELQRRRAADA